IVIMIIFTRILHLCLKRFRQPRIISEVIGGIILGPSILGRITGYTNTLFPRDSFTYLKLLTNLGAVLFLFMFGVELNPAITGKNIKSVVCISSSGIILPSAMV
ncbi:15572_t:CDS:1, partial [Racocetra persica]